MFFKSFSRFDFKIVRGRRCTTLCNHKQSNTDDKWIVHWFYECFNVCCVSINVSRRCFILQCFRVLASYQVGGCVVIVTVAIVQYTQFLYMCWFIGFFWLRMVKPCAGWCVFLIWLLTPVEYASIQSYIAAIDTRSAYQCAGSNRYLFRFLFGIFLRQTNMNGELLRSRKMAVETNTFFI